MFDFEVILLNETDELILTLEFNILELTDLKEMEDYIDYKVLLSVIRFILSMNLFF